MPRPLTDVLLALSLAAHLLVLYLPGDDVPAPAFEVPGLDKLVHVFAFGVPALLAVLLVRRLWPALVLLVHAPVSEALQAALAQGRSGDPADVAADVVGVVLGTGLALVLARRGRTRPPSRPAPGAFGPGRGEGV